MNEERDSQHERNEEERRVPEQPSSADAVEAQRAVSAMIAQETMRITQMNSRRDYKERLLETLHEVAERGTIRPPGDGRIYKDKEAIERAAGVSIDALFPTMLKVFVAYWEGRYRPDAARFQLLLDIIDQEKRMRKAHMPMQSRVDDWAQRYFSGCDHEEKESLMPDNQDPQRVLALFEQDCSWVTEQHLPRYEQREAVRCLRLDFLRNEYPIVLGRDDPASRDAVRRDLQKICKIPKKVSGLNLRPQAVAVALQRYRKNVALGLDHESEEIKRKEEARTLEAIHQRELEKRREDIRMELEFLESLELPKDESIDWPQMLQHYGYTPSFNIRPELRETVHDEIRELIAHLPKEHEYYGDPWGVITHLLIEYWTGHYRPDALRRMVMQNELQLLPPGYSHTPNGKPTSQYHLRELYIEGGSSKNASLLATQDPIIAGRAYQRDIQLIRQLGLDERTLRATEWEYNEWLIEGNMPIVADREVPEDREKLERILRSYVQHRQAKGFFSPLSIVNIFYEHWYPIAQRVAPKKE